MTSSTPTPLPVLPTVSPAELTRILEEYTPSHPVLVAAKDITVTSDAAYHKADGFLSLVRAERRNIKSTLYDAIIHPIRAGLDVLYAINRKVDGPFEQAETEVKRKMADWQLQERRRIAEEERKRKEKEDEDRRRIQEELDKQERERVAALTQQAELAEVTGDKAGAETLYKKAEEVLTAPAPTISFLQPAVAGPVRGAHSTSKPTMKWRVVDMDLVLDGVSMGLIPKDVLVVDAVAVNRYFKGEAGQKQVGSWPGFSTFDDVTISSR